MKANALALIATALTALFATACGEDDTVGAAGEAPNVTHAAGALLLTPRVDVRGVDAVFETLRLDHLDFDAELFVLPTDNRNDYPGAVVAIRVSVDDGVARTDSLDGDLALDHAGRYRVLLRIDPSEDGTSVNVGGAVVDAGAITRGKAFEPAPIAADDDGEGEEGDDEPAPTPAEPAPTPAEPAPTPARAKPDQPGFDPGDSRVDGAEVSVSSRASFEFYVGVVEIETDDSELVITWDVSTWLRDVLAEPLGINPDPGEQTTAGVPGAFHDIAAAFQLIAQ